MKPVHLITQYTGMKSPLDFEDYIGLGGIIGLKNALNQSADKVIDIVKESGLRGRGGAGFPAGLKWESVNGNGTVYFVCNADEGEPGTFKDRYIMERSPYLVIEGMIIGAYAVGAARGFIYIRGEYPETLTTIEHALNNMRSAGYLGENILGTGFSFEIDVKQGGGSYVVGDETALLNSIMGNRGYPMLKPPFPTESGLWEKPTVINNVETLAYVPIILQQGADSFREYGTEECPGPKLFCLSGHVKKPGVYEFPMGVTPDELIGHAGGVTGYLKALQIGGTAGPVYDRRALQYPLDYVSMRDKGGALGSGAVVVMNSEVNMVEVLEVTSRFFSEESCGQCFPCRYGTRQLEYMARALARGAGRMEYLQLIPETVEVMKSSSYCPFGQSVALPVNTLMEFFGNEIRSHIKHQRHLREAV